MNNQNFMQHENFISNKENLNGFDDMDEPMDIDPSTPFANKMRQTSIRTQEEQLIENTDVQFKEQQPTNGPKIVKPMNGPKIVKPIRPNVVAPKVIRPQGLPLPEINNEFNEEDPFKTKSKLAFDTTEFQTPGGFNLRLSDETINEDIKNYSITDEQDPFKTKSNIMNSPVRGSPPPKSNLFKSPPPPPIFTNDDLNSNIDELSNSTDNQMNAETNSLNDEWETHQKRSSSNRSLNNSLGKQNKSPLKQSTSAVSSNTDLSSSDNVLSSPPPNKNHMLGLSTSPSESASESTSIYSSNTASTSSINNKNNELCENELSDSASTKGVWPAKTDEPKLSDETPKVEARMQDSDDTDLKTPTKQNMEDNNDDLMNHLKNNNFIGSSRVQEPEGSVAQTNEFEANLVDFSDNNDEQLVDTNIETDKSNDTKAVENVVFDSIFSSDSDFNSFLDLLEKKEVDNSIKNSPKYSEFARKSLYLQFDPITQLNLSSSLSPEKVKRLSLIVDKQKAIKSYLCDIAETDTIAEDEENDLINQLPVSNTTREKLVETLSEATNTNTDKGAVVSDTTIDKTKTTSSEKLIDIKKDIESVPVNEPESNKLSDEIISKAEEKIQPQPEMIISNNDVGLADNSSEIFSKKLNLNSDSDPMSNNKNESKKAENEEVKQENNLIQVDESTKPIVIEERLSQDKNISKANASIIDLDKTSFKGRDSDISFKLMTDDSMMLDESQLLAINNKSSRVSENSIKEPVAAPVNTKNSSSEDLSSSSVCMSSASTQEMTKLVNELNELKEREKSHLFRIEMLEEENEKFKTVAIDFEEIFKNLIKDKEEGEVKLKNEIIELTKERDQLQEDVIGVERAFDDLHRRFEKLKTKVEEFKKNEESLTNAIEVYKQQLEKEKCKYSTLKKHAEEKIEFANAEIEKVRKSSAVEISRLTAELRKAEIKISSLDLSVQQKDQENSQLTNLLEDLLQKVKPT